MKPIPLYYFIDMDGTLIDTDYANFLAYQHAVREVTDGRLDIRYEAGRRFDRQALKQSFPQMVDFEFARIVSLKTDCYEQFLPETKLNTVLIDRLRMISTTSKKVLVTDSEKRRAELTLRYHKVYSLFHHCCYCESAQSGNKYYRALSRFRVSPQYVVVYENEAVGINRAVLAGIKRENILSVNWKPE